MIEIVTYNKDYVGLARDFRVNPTSCGNPEHYESYIKYSAISDRNAGLGTTQALVETNEDSKKMLGFVTLRTASVITQHDGNLLGEPAIEIAELAVDMTAEKKGYGKLLVDIVLSLADKFNANFLGIRYVTLCADPQAVPFYEKLGFANAGDYYKIPREGWNVSCTPMFIRLPERSY